MLPLLLITAHNTSGISIGVVFFILGILMLFLAGAWYPEPAPWHRRLLCWGIAFALLGMYVPW